MVHHSRLARRQEARRLRQAVLFVFLTIGLGLVVIFLGIPALIKLAVFVGNWRETNTPIESQDSLAPAPPQIKPPLEATKESQIKIEGFAEAGATVTIFNNGLQAEETVAAEDGAFLFANFPLSEGENQIYVLVTDQTGNQSQPSTTFNVNYDQKAPELTIENFESLNGSFVSQERLEIKGKISEEAKLMINDRFVILGAENTFQYSYALQEGENKIKLMAQDEAGNQTERELTVTRG